MTRKIYAPDRGRTCNLQFRRLTLYPVELQAQKIASRISYLRDIEINITFLRYEYLNIHEKSVFSIAKTNIAALAVCAAVTLFDVFFVQMIRLFDPDTR